MKKYFLSILLFIACLFYIACGGSSESEKSKLDSTAENKDEIKPNGNLGIGKFTKVELAKSLDDSLIALGAKIYGIKCWTCHKMNNERLVGPGWKNITKRRTPEWIMNFLTNMDEMLNKDPDATAMIATWYIKMPQQNLTEEDARALLEYMRKNDDEK